jgi:hypothetical protein
MTDIRLRPRFDRALRCSKKEAMDLMRSTLDDPDIHIRCSVFRNSCVLKVPLDDVRFWSPQLQLSIEEKSDDEAELHGIYGPRPSVWSIFIAAYSAIAFLGTMGMIYGYSQWSIGEPAVALWSGPVAIFVAMVVWIIGRFGRSRGMSQMLMLRDVMLRAIGAKMDED